MNAITQADLENLTEIRRLLWEAMDHYTADPDSSWKSSEGAVSLHFTNYFEPESPAWCEVYSYALGPSRNHSFRTTGLALAEVKKWHAAEMAREPWCDPCDREHAGDCPALEVPTS